MPQLDQLITLYVTLLIFFTTVTFSSTNTTDSLFITLKQLELDFKDQIRHFLLSKTGVHKHEKSFKPNKFKKRWLKLLIYFAAKKKKILTIYGQYIIFLLAWREEERLEKFTRWVMLTEIIISYYASMRRYFYFRFRKIWQIPPKIYKIDTKFKNINKLAKRLYKSTKTWLINKYTKTLCIPA